MSSGDVVFRPHLRKRNNPTRISCIHTDKELAIMQFISPVSNRNGIEFQKMAIKHERDVIVRL